MQSPSKQRLINTRQASFSESTSRCESYMQDARSEIIVLLERERSHYAHDDYMINERPPPAEQANLLESIVHECANIITDLSFFPIFEDGQSPKSTKMIQKNSVISRESTQSIRDVQGFASTEYVDDHNNTCQQETFTFWRREMYDWGRMVVDRFDIDRNVLSVSFHLLDRFIAKKKAIIQGFTVKQDDFQLYSMACLYIAIKIQEPYPRKLGIEALIDFSGGYYSKELIEDVELDIIRTVDWLLHAPTALEFIRLFLRLFPILALSNASIEKIYATSEELVSISVASSFFVSCKQCTVGLASILLAVRLEGLSDACLEKLCCNLGEELTSTIRNTDEFRAVYVQLERIYCHGLDI